MRWEKETTGGLGLAPIRAEGTTMNIDTGEVMSEDEIKVAKVEGRKRIKEGLPARRKFREENQDFIDKYKNDDDDFCVQFYRLRRDLEMESALDISFDKLVEMELRK